MSTVSWETVQQWIIKNPYQKHTLRQSYVEEHATVEKDSEDSKGWKTRSVQPATPLSAVLLLQDEIYTATPITARKAQLRDETTDLQEKAALHLKGRGWPVRRTAEGISAVGLEEERLSLWTDLGWRAMCQLRECQIILVDDKKKEIKLYPEDVTTWSSEIDTFFLNHTVTTILVPPSDFNLSSWLITQESENWTIDWPEVNGTMEELSAMAEKVGESCSGKITKDILRRRVSRAQVMKHLKSWI